MGVAVGITEDWLGRGLVSGTVPTSQTRGNQISLGTWSDFSVTTKSPSLRVDVTYNFVGLLTHATPIAATGADSFPQPACSDLAQKVIILGRASGWPATKPAILFDLFEIAPHSNDFRYFLFTMDREQALDGKDDALGVTGIALRKASLSH